MAEGFSLLGSEADTYGGTTSRDTAFQVTPAVGDLAGVCLESTTESSPRLSSTDATWVEVDEITNDGDKVLVYRCTVAGSLSVLTMDQDFDGFTGHAIVVVRPTDLTYVGIANTSGGFDADTGAGSLTAALNADSAARLLAFGAADINQAWTADSGWTEIQNAKDNAFTVDFQYRLSDDAEWVADPGGTSDIVALVLEFASAAETEEVGAAQVVAHAPAVTASTSITVVAAVAALMLHAPAVQVLQDIEFSFLVPGENAANPARPAGSAASVLSAPAVTVLIAPAPCSAATGEKIDEFVQQDDVSTVSVQGGSAQDAVGQSWRAPDVPSELTGVCVRILRNGSIGGTVRVSVYAHTGAFGSGGEPTGAALVSSADFDAGVLGTSAADYFFPLSGWTPTADTPYFVVLDASGQTGSGSVAAIIETAPDSTHEGNAAIGVIGGAWAGQSSDVAFKLYASVGRTHLVGPAPLVVHAPSVTVTATVSVALGTPPVIAAAPAPASVYVIQRAIAEAGTAVLHAPNVAVQLGEASRSASPAAAVPHAPAVSLTAEVAVTLGSAAQVIVAPAVTVELTVTGTLGPAALVATAPAVTVAVGALSETLGAARAVLYAPALGGVTNEPFAWAPPFTAAVDDLSTSVSIDDSATTVAIDNAKTTVGLY